MNAQTQLTHHLIRPHTVVRAATRAALCTLVLIGASATAPVALATETLATKVSLSDLDLSTSQGARAALKRIRTVARRLCSEFRNSNVTGNREAFDDCVRDSLERAVGQVHSPTLAALER